MRVDRRNKLIGREFIRSFEDAAREIVAEGHSVDFLVQGTLYPDVVESGGGTGTANIKSHHNVGGLPDDLQFSLVEPLRTLFKDEVRRVGEELDVGRAHGCRSASTASRAASPIAASIAGLRSASEPERVNTATAKRRPSG